MNQQVSLAAHKRACSGKGQAPMRAAVDGGNRDEDYKANLMGEGLEMLKNRQKRKQTDQDVQALENRVRILQRHEKTSYKKILIQ